MNILERADKFAEGKANEAITKAIAQAFVKVIRQVIMTEKWKSLPTYVMKKRSMLI